MPRGGNQQDSGAECPPGLRSGRSGLWLGELTINLAEAPVLAQLWDPGTQLEVEGGPVGGQVLIRGPQQKARALIRLAAHATRWWRQLRGVVIDLQDLNGQGPSGRAGWRGCRQERQGELLALLEQTAPPPRSLLHGVHSSETLGSDREAPPGAGSPGAQAYARPSPSSQARIMALYQPSLRKGDAGLSTRWVWTQPVALSTCSQSSGS